MKPQDFQSLALLLKTKSGLALTADKEYLLESRLLPVARKWRLASVEELAERIRSHPDETQIRDVVEAMTTNESSFFRDTKPFDVFRNHMLPALVKARAARRSLRIWSAAASTGQEAYSLAMLVKESGALLAGWNVEIIGTDLSGDVLERAKAGTYTHFEVQRGLPVQMLVKYFRQAGDKWQIADELRRMVSFRHFNLLHSLAGLGQFDVVFCRNVLIYFDRPTKAQVLDAIGRQMQPDGFLVLGGAETILGVTERLHAAGGQPGIYTPVATSAGLQRAV